MKNNEEALGRTLGNYTNTQMQGQYDRSANLAENDRNRQLQAAGGAVGLSGARGSALTNALNAGGMEQTNFQNLLNSQGRDWDQYQQYPEHQLGIFGNALGSLLGRSGGSTTTQGPGADPFAQGLGAWQLGNQMNSKGGSGGALDYGYNTGATGLGTSAGW